MVWAPNARHLGRNVAVVLEEIQMPPAFFLVIMGRALLLALGALEFCASLRSYAQK